MTDPARHGRREVLATLGSVAAVGLGGCLGIGGGGDGGPGDDPDGAPAATATDRSTETGGSTATSSPTPVQESTLRLVDPWAGAFGTDGARVVSRPTGDDGLTAELSGRLVNRADPPATLTVAGYWLRTTGGRYCHEYQVPRTVEPGGTVALDGSFPSERSVESGDVLVLAAREGRADRADAAVDSFVVTPPDLAVEGIQGTRLVAEDAVAVDLTLRNRGEEVFDPTAVGSVFLACASDGANAERDLTPSAGDTLDRTVTIDPGESRMLRYTNRSNGVYSVAEADFAYLLVGPPADSP